MSQLTSPRFGYVLNFREDLKTQTFSFSGNNFNLRRSFRCAWQDRFRLCNEFLGSAVITGQNTVIPQISRFCPLGYDALKDAREFSAPASARPFLFPVGVSSIDGVGPTRKLTPGGGGGGLVPQTNRYADKDLYQEALVHLDYDALTFPVRTDDEVPLKPTVQKTPPSQPTLVTTNFTDVPTRDELKRFTTRITQPHSEVLTLPVGTRQYVEGLEDGTGVQIRARQPVTTGVLLVNSVLDVTYIWHRVPALIQPYVSARDANGDEQAEAQQSAQWLYQEPTAHGRYGLLAPELIGAAYTHAGTVNDDWFDGFPPGTLLLLAIEARPYKWVTGERYYDYTYRMKYFNPPDRFRLGQNTFAVPPGSADGQTGRFATRTVSPRAFSYVGHNYILRQAIKKGDPSKPIDPYYSLITHNGNTLEDNGIPTYAYRDFDDLFIPYSRAHLQRYYQMVTSAPVF